MKLITVVALLVFFQAAPSVLRKATNQAEANEKRTSSPSSTPDTNNAPIDNGDGQTKNPHVSQPFVRISQIYGVPVKENGIDWRLWVFSGLLVIVGGFQVWLLYRTLGAIKRQADIMETQAKSTETAANAARISADALIASERAWVIPELIPICARFNGQWHRPVGHNWAQMSDDELLNGDHLRHTLRFRNLGRTPASLLGFEFEFLVLKEGVRELPKVGETGKIGVQLTSKERFEHYLAGGKSMDYPIPVNVDFFMGKDRKEIMNLTRTAIFRWQIRYCHVFSKEEISESSLYYFSPNQMALVKTMERKDDQQEGTESPG
jgi:hypothetical protein